MTALVTGAAGFLGRALVRRLREDDRQVVAFDVATGVHELAEIGATTEQGDLGRWNDLLDVVTAYGPEVVFHCGALLSAAAEADPTAAYEANATGTHNLLEIARTVGIDRIVFTSTMATFGRGAGDPVADDAPQWPTTIYGATKVFGERLVEYHHLRYGTDVRALRFPSIVGTGRGGSGASGYSSMVFDAAAHGAPYQLYVGPDTRCQLLHVDDAVAALLALAEAAPERLSRRIYNIGGIAPTAQELVEAIRRVLPEARLGYEPDPELEAIVGSWPLRLDDRNAHRDWGWKLGLDLDGIVARFVADARTEVAP
ncbi:MAG: NAD-dependent epimerase/dehydratase family protein [Actinobacteria bacterium]|nr:NAD-dependent epimerase/dehydratase family protein [Actinomycetota bacterium]